ncbi:MAG: histidine kinase, partial [Chromatocurvus sp.]
MTPLSNLLSLALLYVSLLFAIAWWFDRRSKMGASVHDVRLRPWVSALSLGVYCSSWTFYGAVGSSSAQPWSHAPVYLGPILLCLFGWPVLARLVHLGVRHRVTSIADYLGARYGKRQSLSMLVTAVATAAVLPYIGLQFRALDQAWSVMVADRGVPLTHDSSTTTLLIAVLLAAFTLLFGTRRLDGRERHPGVMNAIAVESLVKLLAFVAVAIFALVQLRGIALPGGSAPAFTAPDTTLLSADFLAHTLLS